MISIQHHIREDILLSYCAGMLDEATSILVATHLALCPACRKDAELAEALGGCLLENVNIEEAQFSGKFSVNMVNRNLNKYPNYPFKTPASHCSESYVLPQPLRRYTGCDVSKLSWHSVGGGVRQCQIATNDQQKIARLLLIPAGVGVPDHGHRGFEATLVLSGSFYDRDSWYRRGDIAFADPTIVHHPVSGPEEDCICLAVTDDRLKFSGIIPRILQPFHGI